MSQVRITNTAESILPFCRPWHDRYDNTCFESYAEMVIFAAGLGFSVIGKRPPPSASSFLDQPYPISIEIFISQQLFPIMLLLALAVSKDKQIARDEKKICGILEDYADKGFLELNKLLSKSNPQEFHIELGRLIVKTKSPKL